MTSRAIERAGGAKTAGGGVEAFFFAFMFAASFALSFASTFVKRFTLAFTFGNVWV